MYYPSDKPIKQSPPQSFFKIIKENNKKPSKISKIKKFLRKYIQPKNKNTYEILYGDFQIIEIEDHILQK